MNKQKKSKSQNIIKAITVRRGIWMSNHAYGRVNSELRFPSFDILVMNVYHARVVARSGIFWQMKATSNGSFYLFPKSNRKEVEVSSRNGKRACLSVESSGIVATLLTFKMLDDYLSAAGALSRLLEYARQLPEFPVIASLIDG